MRRLWSRFVKLSVATMLLIPFAAAIASPVHAQSSGDCDDNAVIRCGVSGATELKQKYQDNQAGNVQAIFAEFGIDDRSDLNGMVRGHITSDNEIYYDGELVATEAVTAGRQNMPGSTPILNGQAYTRPPSVSFNSDRLPALIKLNGQEFQYAVILSCGNPVTAKPVKQPEPKTPDFEIKKDVRREGESSWYQKVSAKPGEHLEYRITVQNTGETELTNMRIRDRLPEGLTPVGTEGSNTEELFDDGVNLGTLAIDQQRRITFEVRIDDDTEACKDDFLKNITAAKPDELVEKQDDALAEVCKPTPPPKPEPKPEPEPEEPKKLPDTGAVGVAGVFSATTVAGVALHRLKEFYEHHL